MIGDPFTMVVAIVLIVSIAGVLRAKYKASHGILEDEDGNDRLIDRTDQKASEAEIARLKERIAVLERIATDDRGSRELDREIQKLREH